MKALTRIVRVVQLPDDVLQRLGVERDVEAALRRELLRPLGHQRHLVRPHLHRHLTISAVAAISTFSFVCTT